MIYILLTAITPLLLLLVSLFLYKKDYACMQRFYYAMLAFPSARKFYTWVLLIFLLCFHFVYTTGHPFEHLTLLSAFASISLYSEKWSAYIMFKLHDNKKRFFRLSFFAIVLAAIPHCYAMAVTLAFFLVEAAFYPSRTAVEKFDVDTFKESRYEFPKGLSDFYY